MSRRSFTTNNSSLFGQSRRSQLDGDSVPKENSYAMPKGAKTRSAIALHLANKLKIDPKADPSSIIKQYQNIIAESGLGQEFYWEQEIQIAREKIAVEYQKRIEIMKSDKFLDRQKKIKSHVTKIFEENEFVKKEAWLESQRNGRLNILSDDSDDDVAVLTDESLAAPTTALISQYEMIYKDSLKLQGDAAGDTQKYFLKLSIKQHHKSRQAWEILITVIVLYSIFVIPIRIGINERLFDPAYDGVDIFTWICYILDVIINLRTTYIDENGFEVVDSKSLVTNYVFTFRFVCDILSIFGVPSSMLREASQLTRIVLNFLGLLKLFRYFRTQSLIVNSNMDKVNKSYMITIFYFLLLIIYLHIAGCLFFFFSITSYKGSSTRIQILTDLKAVQKQADGTIFYPIPRVEESYLEALESLKSKGSEAAQVPAWNTCVDNFDGTERLWRRYELSTFTFEEKQTLLNDGGIAEFELDRSDWAFIWSLSIYYSVVVIGGNELQPAQPTEFFFGMVMNVIGFIFITWISGEVAVIVANLGSLGSAMQSTIDEVNSVMNQSKLSGELQNSIRSHFLRVQGTMAEQDELENFFQDISAPLRIVVYKELFTKILLSKNTTIKDVMKDIVSLYNHSELVLYDQRDQIQGKSEVNQISRMKMLNERIDNLLPAIVGKLDSSLQPPHHTVIEQGAEHDFDGDNKPINCAFYYLGKGTCKVKVKDNQGKVSCVRNLADGDHFGEVAVLYKCRRSATVISLNYNTFAVMQATQFKSLVGDYPEYERCLKNYVVNSYRDARVKFLIEIVRRIEYLDTMPDDIAIDFIFSLQPKVYEQGQDIFSQDTLIDSIYFIEKGQVEVSTIFEGNKFVIDTLHPGAAINYRAILLRDHMYVNMKATSEVHMLSISIQKLITLVKKHSEYKGHDKTEQEKKLRAQQFSGRVKWARNRYLNSEKSFPLDYLNKLPNQEDTKELRDRFYHKNLLKNVVMRIVEETRVRKNRPKLYMIMAIYQQKKHEPSAKANFQDKFLKLYGSKEVIGEEHRDEKYETLMNTLQRIKQHLSGQQVALSNLVMKVNNLIEKKQKRINRKKYIKAEENAEDGVKRAQSNLLKIQFAMDKSANQQRNSAKQESQAMPQRITLKPRVSMVKDKIDEYEEIKLAADQEQQEMIELQLIDRKYMVQDKEDSFDEIYAREARKLKKDDDEKPLQLMVSPYIKPKEDMAQNDRNTPQDPDLMTDFPLYTQVEADSNYGSQIPDFIKRDFEDFEKRH